MAIAHDSSVNGPQGTATSWTWNHTCSGENRFLVVFAHQVSNLTGATYGGVAMTATSVTGDVMMYHLVNPKSGTNAIVVSGSNGYSRFCSSSYNGVDQDNPINVQGGTSPGTVTSITGTLTTTKPDCWILMGMRGAGTVTAGANTTKRGNPGGDGQEAYGDSNAARAVGSNSCAFSGTSGTYYSREMAIAPHVPPSGGSPMLFGGGVSIL